MSTETPAIVHPLTVAQRALNKAMKAQQRPTGWKLQTVGSFLACTNAEDVRVSDAYEAQRWVERNVAHWIDLSQSATIAHGMMGNTIINWSRS